MTHSGRATVVRALADAVPIGRVLLLGDHQGWLEAFLAAGATAAVVVPPLAAAALPPDVSVVRNDLRSPLVVDEPFELAFVGPDVAPTIPVDVAHAFVAGLRGAAETIAFVAPAPGLEAGTVPRWPRWWDSLFEQHGLHPDDSLRWDLWDDDRIELVVRQGIVVYRSDDRPAPHGVDAEVLRSVVHPEVHHRVVVAAADGYDREVRAREEQLVAAEVERRRLAARAAGLEAELERAEERIADLSARSEPGLVQELEWHIISAEERAGDADRRLAVRAAASAAAARDAVAARYRPVPWRDLPRHPSRVALRAATALVRRRGGPRRLGAPAPLFDGAWYVTRYPDVAESSLNPLWHYRRHGAAMGRSPHPMFDVEWYRRTHGADLPEGVDPVVDHLTEGWRAGRDPHPVFLQSWYVEQVDLTGWARSPLEHYLEVGAPAGASPHPLCDAAWLRAQGCPSPDHYLRVGWRDEVDPHPLFDAAWYLTRHADVAVQGIDPLSHYLQTGWREGRDPHPLFDVAWYLEAYPDVAAAGVEPLTHYVLHGAAELRSPGPLFDAVSYVEAHPELRGPSANAAVHFLTGGARSG